MPSSPKIKKEIMLQTALEIVIESGYAALNIKAVAQRLNCSTAPISWQFGGMKGLRSELIPFAERYVMEKYMIAGENEVDQFEKQGKNTVDLALDEPNLFRFLFMEDRDQPLSEGFQILSQKDRCDAFYQSLAQNLGLTVEEAVDFVAMMVVYTQGIGTLIASGIVVDTRENIYRMLHKTGMTYLKGLGSETFSAEGEEES